MKESTVLLFVILCFYVSAQEDLGCSCSAKVKLDEFNVYIDICEETDTINVILHEKKHLEVYVVECNNIIQVREFDAERIASEGYYQLNPEPTTDTLVTYDPITYAVFY